MRKTPLNRKRKTKRRIYLERAHKAWATLVKIRAGWVCEKCGRPTTLQAHHIRPSTYARTRYDLLNGVSLCWQHHKQWAHGDGPGFTEWLRSHHLDRYDAVVKPGVPKPIHRTDSEVLAIAIDLEAQVAKYEQREAA